MATQKGGGYKLHFNIGGQLEQEDNSIRAEADGKQTGCATMT